MAELFPVTNTQTSSYDLQFSDADSSETREPCRPLSGSHPVPSLSPATDTKISRQSMSLPELRSSFEEFTPDISVDEDNETYRFKCSSPGLYQCTVTGLVFHMEGGGGVVYRTVPWDRRQLSRHHKKPAGPLFDIQCVQQCVCQLHLPHLAHVTDEGIEFIRPQKITETHIVLNITGFSGYGNVKDEDSPPDPVRALVLLFYRPPEDPDPESLINVLLLPKNISLRNVVQSRKRLVGHETYIETSPHCKLQPEQTYTLSTCPEDVSVLVQPTEAEFDSENYDNYLPSFQVILGDIRTHLKLFLTDTRGSFSAWERRVCLRSTEKRKSCGLNAGNQLPNQRLLDVRSCFIDGISEPVLKSLLDKLLETKVMTDSERESVDEMDNKRDKARFVIDTVRKKGEAAGSEMMELLCELDPFLCGHLGLM
ncbi:hypothetical protein Q5P01_004448 [Channa striata]|uniref:Caspase recruitment domain-containing protein 8 n=1 Tax=Channa striata TaxID=64152 RepID=A0AA88T197_CHASR|nr:hypothetical protein Q5P01_004448 [Channa striata]